MKWVLVLVLFRSLSILDLPRRYAKEGNLKSAINAYNEIYKTSSDSVIKYQALFEESLLYLKLHDTISALTNLYKLSTRFLPDSLDIQVFSMLFKLDSKNIGKNIQRFAYFYPDIPKRKKILTEMLNRLLEEKDTMTYVNVLKVLSSDYGTKYRSQLSLFLYKNGIEKRVFPSLFKANPLSSYYYYIRQGDTFSAFYTLFGIEDEKSRKLRLKILFNLGAYDACFRMIPNTEKDTALIKIKILSAVFMRQNPDSILRIVDFYRNHDKKIYEMIERMLDSLPDFHLLRAYSEKDPYKALLYAHSANSGFLDTVLFKLAIYLTTKGEYAYAKDILKNVKHYYPLDTLLFWKNYLKKMKKMPQDILLSTHEPKEVIKELFDNGYYAEVVQYAKGKILPENTAFYIAKSLYMLWKLYGRKSYLKNAFGLVEKYKKAMPRKFYFEVVFNYDPSLFDIGRYKYDNLNNEELYYLYFLLKTKNKAKLIKDFSKKNFAKFLYYISMHNTDSALIFLPEKQKFYPLLYTEYTLNTEDSFKVYKKLSDVSIDYRRYPAKKLLMNIIPIALRFNDFLGTDTLLQKYEKYFGRDKFYVFYRTKLDYILQDYKKSLLYSLFFQDDSFQVLCALSLLKMNNLKGIANLTLNKYAKNLLYLKTGMIKKVDPLFLDESDVRMYLNELLKVYGNTENIKEILITLLKNGKIDSMTYIAYGIHLGFLQKDSVYLSEYSKSLLKYLLVKRLMRENKLDSALLIIGNPQNAVDSFRYLLYFKRGTILYLKKKYQKSYQSYIMASKFESLKDAALFNAYLAAKRTNKYELVIKSLKDYIKGCTKCEKLQDVYISLGFNYMEEGKIDSAIDILKSVEGYFEKKNEAELKYWLGTCYMQDSLLLESAGYFMRVYKFHQKDGDWGDTGGLNAARLCYLLGLKEKAKRIYNSIIKRRKNDAIVEEAKKEVSLIK